MRYLLAATVIALSVLVYTLDSNAGTWSPNPDQYCLPFNGCKLQTPIPDSNTRDELYRYINSLPSDNRPKPGDTITICDAASCTTYTYTNDHSFNGGKNEPRQNHGGNGGGGGGHGGGGGGGINPPGGCYGSSCYDFDCKVGGRPCSMLPTGTPLPPKEEQ